MRTNLFHIVLLCIVLMAGNTKTYAQEPRINSIPIPPAKQQDTTAIPVPPAITKATDSVKPAVVRADSVKKTGTGLDAIVKRTADGYEKLDQKKKELTLYDKAELNYNDIQLKAGIIVMKYDKDEVHAGRIKDSLGNYMQYPYFKQGTNIVEADSIHFNTKTKKARIWNTKSDQGEFRIKGDITKKENDSVYFIKGARFTTSKNIDDPEYYFYTNKIKFVPGKKVVVGVTNMVIAGVPTPLGLPFAFFPMTQEAESGFIIPTFGDNNTQGYFLQNGGYYLALSDYYDLTVLGDYYTNGSYGLRFQSSYAQRYRFNGNINVRFENNIISERGFPDYQKSRQYNIQWSHNQDAKANPNSRFAASVNLGSSQFFRQSQNIVNVGSSLNNTMNSSVSYSKTFTSVPQVNVTVAATHNQNTNTEQINMTLPSINASVDRIFPFAPADAPKQGLIKNINLQYNVTAENRIATTDSLFFKPQMFRDARSGMQHSIPLSTNFKVFKYFSVTANANYQETWYLETQKREFSNALNRVDTIDVAGFDRFGTYNFGSSIGTTIYGTFNFGENKKIQAIRHVMRPSVSYNYTPAFDNYYENYALDATSTRFQQYSRFQDGIYGAPGLNKSQNIGFALNNTLEAKVRDEDETKTEPRKVVLLNNLNLTTAYNISADSLAWSPLRVTGGTNIFKEKMSINFGATFDPYAIDNSGTRINTYNIDNGGSLFRFTDASVNIGYSVSSRGSESGANRNENTQTARNGGREDDLFGTAADLSDRRTSMFNDDETDTEKADKTEGGFYNSKLPFDLRFAYTLTYSNNRREKNIVGNSLMVSGNVDITPRWKLGLSSGYDFVQKGVTFTQLRFERDLLSWRMDFNWVPFGNNTFWGFFIGIKSSVLSDIKWEKRQVPDRRLQ